MKSKRYLTRRGLPCRNALVVALALGMGVSGLAYAQATNGSIFGQAPAGDMVQVTNNAGFNRAIQVPASGNYTLSNLPLGTYTVTLKKNGQAVSSRQNIAVSAGGGSQINFAGGSANAQQLSGVTVSANALPAIDVTKANDSTIITSAQLKHLPLGRNSSSIALLTPGTVAASGYFSGTGGNAAISIGGSSAAENAYYVNGYNTGNLYTNIGGYSLPYGAIAQQETISGGFSAKYGRSDGGVISQIGKSGTNEWHYGVQVLWAPRSLQSHHSYFYLPEQPLYTNVSPPFTRPANREVGKLYSTRRNDRWSTQYTGYIGGPLIKDKLFLFVDAQVSRQGFSQTSSIAQPRASYGTDHHTEFYGKINWNINDNNTLEATYLQRKGVNGVGSRYIYDYDTMQSGAFDNSLDQSHINSKFEILKYTSYISDNATLSVTYGHGSVTNPVTYAVDPSIPLISNANLQDHSKYQPGVTAGPGGITGSQVNASVTQPDSHLSSHGLRADFTYQLGNHQLQAGIDNMYYSAIDQGTSYTGPVAPAAVQEQAQLLKKDVPKAVVSAMTSHTRWIYEPGFVLFVNIDNNAGMSTKQKAYYLQDNWQITPNLLFNIGVRNDHFINLTQSGTEFVNEKNQWEPRLGLSWDVFGDSSLKLYANAGRYYLALPQNAANRAANASTYIEGYYNYTSIDANGVPHGLTAIPGNGLFSPDGEYGQSKPVKQVVSQNLKPQYVDMFNVGFDAQLNALGTTWTYGAKAQYRKLGTVIDDECDAAALDHKIGTLGLDPADYTHAGCILFNPGSTNEFVITNNATGKDRTVQMAWSDFGYTDADGVVHQPFPEKPKRKIASLNLYFAHPFDGKWYARLDYTYTAAYGNTSGQIRPDFGQADVSKTEDWDFPSLMVGQYGQLLNSRRHVFKLRGSYKITPDWIVSLVGTVASGHPQECLGYYGPDATGDPAGYNAGGSGNYHYCDGRVVHPGSSDPLAGHTPWTHQYDLGVTWSPSFANHNLNVAMTVFNVLNEQKAVQTIPSLPQSLTDTPPTRLVNPFFHTYVTREAPRYVRFSVSYDY